MPCSAGVAQQGRNGIEWSTVGVPSGRHGFAVRILQGQSSAVRSIAVCATLSFCRPRRGKCEPAAPKIQTKAPMKKLIKRATQTVKITDESIKNRPKTNQTNKHTNDQTQAHKSTTQPTEKSEQSDRGLARAVHHPRQTLSADDLRRTAAERSAPLGASGGIAGIAIGDDRGTWRGPAQPDAAAEMRLDWILTLR